MKKKMKKNNAPMIVLLLLALSLVTVGASRAQTRLVGQDGGDVVRLMWLPQQWPAELDGFELRRRVGDGPWQRLHDGVLVPSIKRGRDLSHVEPSLADRARARAALDQMIDRGELRAASSAEVLSIFRADPQAMSLWSLHFTGRFELALAMGFGFVDRSPPPAAEYGLFAVQANVADEPLATFHRRGSNGKDGDAPVMLEASVRKVARDELAVAWAFDAAQLEARGLAGFQVFRRDTEGLVQIGPGDFILTAGGKTAAVVDKGRDPQEAAVYAITTIDYFGRRGPLVDVTWQPRESKVSALPPRIARAELVGQGAEVAIAWDFGEKNADRASSFLVRRQGAGRSQTFEVPGDQRQWVDVEEKPVGEWYSYTVTALGPGGLQLTSAAAAVFLPEIKTPPVPSGLRARLVKGGDGLVIRLEWDTPEAGDALTAGYVLYANSPPDDRLRRQASLGTLRGQSVDFPVYTSGPATYRFQLAAKSASHDESAATPVLDVETRTTALPPVRLAGVRGKDGALRVEWRFPQLPDLAGFRLYIDGVLVADTDVIGPQARDWTGAWRAQWQEKAADVEVEAVTRAGLTKRSFPSRLRPPRR